MRAGMDQSAPGHCEGAGLRRPRRFPKAESRDTDDEFERVFGDSGEWAVQDEAEGDDD